MVANNAQVEAVKTYFQALDNSDFQRAVDQFTEAVTYIHPPMYDDTTHIHGRMALLEYLTEVRGRTDNIHIIERAVSGDNATALVGYIAKKKGGDPIDHFVAYATFEGDRIDHYIAGLLYG